MNDSKTAVIWIIIISIYFIALATTFSIVGSFADDYDVELNDITHSGGADSISDISYCTGPRFGENTQLSTLSSSILIDNNFITDQTSCEAYEGFLWVENPSIFPWGQSSFSCEGNLNVSYYDGGNTTESTWLGGTALGTGFFNVSLVSDLELLAENKPICESLGFTWSTPEFRLSEEVPNKDSAISLLYDAATFQMTVSTETPLINALFPLFFIWLPLIVLIIAIYMLTPFA